MARACSSLLKIIFLGDTGVGKTSVINQYVTEEFPTTATRVHPLVKTTALDEGQVRMELWDPNGIERFRPLHKPWFRKAHCCVLVYDINNEKSFDSLQTWLDECLEATSSPERPEIPFILLGNKVDDGEKRQVETARALNFCGKNGYIPYFETSAKDIATLEEAFQTAARFGLTRQDIFRKLAEQERELVNLQSSNRKSGCW